MDSLYKTHDNDESTLVFIQKTILGGLFIIDFLVYAIMRIGGFQVSIRFAVTPIKATEVIGNELRSSGPDTKYLWKRYDLTFR